MRVKYTCFVWTCVWKKRKQWLWRSKLYKSFYYRWLHIIIQWQYFVFWIYWKGSLSSLHGKHTSTNSDTVWNNHCQRTGENEFSFTIKQNLKSHTRVRHFNTVWLIKLCWLGLGGRWTLASQLIMWNCSLKAIWVLYRPHEASKLVFYSRQNCQS